MGNFWIFILTVLVSLLGAYLARRFAYQFGLVSRPNERSSHHTTTPHGGGLGLVLSFIVAVSILFSMETVGGVWWAVLALVGTVVALVGLRDDLSFLPAKWRLLTHFGAIATGVALLGGLPPIQIGATYVDLGWMGHVGVVVVLVWWLNLFNFMDGIDGLASTETLYILLAAMLLMIWENDLSSTGERNLFLLQGLLVASTLGFLVWNWSPAKVFMGDVGSTFLGYILGMMTLISMVEKVLAPWVWLILGGVYWVDATVTLLRRMRNKEEWYKAHRDHTYQRVTVKLQKLMKERFGMSDERARAAAHQRVCLGVLIINILWLTPWAYLSLLWPAWGWGWMLIAWLPLVWVVMNSARGPFLKGSKASLIIESLK